MVVQKPSMHLFLINFFVVLAFLGAYTERK